VSLTGVALREDGKCDVACIGQALVDDWDGGAAMNCRGGSSERRWSASVNKMTDAARGDSLLDEEETESSADTGRFGETLARR
jgi:hypothetical protein